MQIKRFVVPVLLAPLLIASCKGRNDRSLEATPAIVDDTASYPDSIQRMQNLQYADTITWRGQTCRFTINRHADDSLPRVEDSHHIHYIDNRISVSVERNGREIFNHTFTKHDFDRWLDDDFRKIGILAGIMFDKIKNGNLLFAASVSDPTQDDWYLPFVISIAPGGAMTIERDNSLDVGAPENDEEDGV